MQQMCINQCKESTNRLAHTWTWEVSPNIEVTLEHEHIDVIPVTKVVIGSNVVINIAGLYTPEQLWPDMALALVGYGVHCVPLEHAIAELPLPAMG